MLFGSFPLCLLVAQRVVTVAARSHAQIVEFTCSDCGTHGTAEKWMRVLDFPTHLLCVAKRFNINFQTSQAYKVLSSIAFPASFRYPTHLFNAQFRKGDGGAAATPSGAGAGAGAGAEGDAGAGSASASASAGATGGAGAGAGAASGAEGSNSEDVVYGLYAVVVHAGASLNTGHYFAYARDR